MRPGDGDCPLGQREQKPSSSSPTLPDGTVGLSTNVCWFSRRGKNVPQRQFRDQAGSLVSVWKLPPFPQGRPCAEPWGSSPRRTTQLCATEVAPCHGGPGGQSLEPKRVILEPADLWKLRCSISNTVTSVFFLIASSGSGNSLPYPCPGFVLGGTSLVWLTGSHLQRNSALEGAIPRSSPISDL